MRLLLKLFAVTLVAQFSPTAKADFFRDVIFSKNQKQRRDVDGEIASRYFRASAYVFHHRAGIRFQANLGFPAVIPEFRTWGSYTACKDAEKMAFENARKRCLDKYGHKGLACVQADVTYRDDEKTCDAYVYVRAIKIEAHDDHARERSVDGPVCYSDRDPDCAPYSSAQ